MLRKFPEFRKKVLYLHLLKGIKNTPHLCGSGVHSRIKNKLNYMNYIYYLGSVAYCHVSVGFWVSKTIRRLCRLFGRSFQAAKSEK